MKMYSYTFNFNMKLFLMRLIIFVITVAILFFCINIFQSRYNVSPSQYKLQYEAVNSTSTSFEGVIIGTSHATHSIRPALLADSGVSFYNFALNGANPKFYYNWYKEVFLKSQKKPEYFIIGIDWFMFDNKRLWRNFEQDSEYFTSDLFLKLFFYPNNFSKKDLVVNRFPFLKYRKDIKKSMKGQIGDERFPIESYDRGYITQRLSFNSNDSKSCSVDPEANVDISQVNYFKKLIAEIVSDKIEIIFVMSPEYNIAPEYYTKMKSLSIVNEISKKYEIPILNFNTDLRSSINENIDFFSDCAHMNDKGSKIFSAYLSKELSKVKKAQAHNRGYIQQ